MLKGKSTIRLFDAASGRTVDEQTNENMITDAVSRLLNPPADYTSYGVSPAQAYADALPLISKGMAGILLWDNTIAENASTVLPPSGVNQVGHAGGAYSGNNPYRGSLNAAETADIPNGKRFVWDFTTAQANGEIKCLSLTSFDGGNTGWDEGADSTGFYKFIGNQVTPYLDGNSYCIGETERGVWVFASVNSKTVTLKYYRAFNSAAVGLSVNPQTAPVLYDTKTFQSIGYIKNPTHWVIYDGIAHSVSCINADSRTFNHAVIDIKNGTLVKEETITLDTLPEGYELNSNYSHGYFYKDWLYIGGLKDRYYYPMCYSSAGKYMGEVIPAGWSGGLETVWGTSDGWLIFNRGNIWAKGLKYRKVPHNISDEYYYSTCYSYRANEILPYITIGYRRSSSYPSLCKITPYLATINNLASAVTKTAAQTMKITYEITET